MTRPIAGRETVNGFLRDLNVRLSRLERQPSRDSGVTLRAEVAALREQVVLLREQVARLTSDQPEET